MANGLAQQLRTATRDAHRASERAGIMPDLLHGRLGRAVYCSLLRNLFEIYQALEAALVLRAALPCVAPVVFPKLFRTAALAADLLVGVEDPGPLAGCVEAGGREGDHHRERALHVARTEARDRLGRDRARRGVCLLYTSRCV